MTATDHLALIYETEAEQFAAVGPFIQEGLEQGERCMYIAGENSHEDIITALRTYGVDVDTALDTGQLSFRSVEDIYLTDGEVNADAVLERFSAAIEDAAAEYDGFRVTTEETWLLKNEAAHTEFMACEAHVNDFFEDEHIHGLCQYNRARLPPELIDDIIVTHPYLVYDGTVCENFYYTPPEEYFGPDDPARDITRKLKTLRDRTEMRTALETQTQFQQRLYDIVAQPDVSFDEKLQALFDLGCELFDMELGAMARVDPETDQFKIERTSATHDYFEPGVELELSETYCTATTDCKGTASVSRPEREGYGDITVRQEFGIQSYLGTYIELSSDSDRTLFFVTSEPREEEITDAERACHHLMGQWVQYELEHQQHEQQLQRKNKRLESFASMLAHELRNPLQIAQIYLQQLGDADSDAVAEIEQALDRIEEMIDVLLVTARTTEAAIDRDAVALADAAAEVWDDLATGSADLVVATTQTVAVDSVHLWHLLENLFRNAVEHGGSGVTVRVSELDEAGGFYVEDDGQGIPQSEREAVFNAGHSTEADGIGLGLTFVAQLAAVYDWDCTVTESAAGGARFEFRDVESAPARR